MARVPVRKGDTYEFITEVVKLIIGETTVDEIWAQREAQQLKEDSLQNER